MKKLLAVLFTVAALAGLTDMVGCKSEEPAAPPAAKLKKADKEAKKSAAAAPTTRPAAPTTSPAALTTSPAAK